MHHPPDHAALLAQARRLTEGIETLRRELVETWRDVHALGGMPTVTGYTPQEWLELVTRMSGFDARRLERFATRLPGLPATAVALHEGAITVDQAATIVERTSRLAGETLAVVDREAVAWTVDVNRRCDFPDVGDAVDTLVREHRPAVEVERSEARVVERSRVVSQAAVTGGGWVYGEWADDTAFATVTAAVEHAAGPPAPDVPRERQRAAGLLAIASAWCADPDRGAARPAVTVLVDLAEISTNNAGQLLRARGRRTPRVNARTLETLGCDASLVVQIVDGVRPLAELKDRAELPDRLRQAVRVRDRGCRWPGCSAPVWQTDVHHLSHRADGGDHDVDNLVCLCRTHHRMLHGPMWTARLDGQTGQLRLWRGRPRQGRDPTHTTVPHGTTPARPSRTGRETSDGTAREGGPDVAREPAGAYAVHPTRPHQPTRDAPDARDARAASAGRESEHRRDVVVLR